MKKLISFISLVLCVSLLLSACGKGQSNTNTPGADSPESSTQDKLDIIRPTTYSNINGLSLEPGSYISIIGRYANDSYWKEVEAGAKKAIEDLNTLLGYKGNKKIKLSYIAPEVRDDVNEQVNLLDEELSRYPVAIGIAAVDATACSIQFDLAAENGIPIITFDSGSNYKNIASHISTDNLDAARTAAAKLAYAMEEKGEVAIFVQDSVSMTAQQRLQGFSEVLTKDFPSISVVHTYHFDQLETMQKTIADERNATIEDEKDKIDPKDISQKEVIEYILEKNPNLKGIYTTNLDTTQTVAKVLTELERFDLKFVGFDGGKEQMKLLENELLEGLIIQNPYGMGYATVVAAVRVAMGLGNESVVNTGYTWVTKENMTTKDIEAMLY